MKKVIMFGAERCVNCKALHPVLEEEMKSYIDNKKAEFYFVDVDKNEDLAKKYNIRGIPQVLIFNNKGDVLTRMAGVKEQEEIKTFLQDNL